MAQEALQVLPRCEWILEMTLSRGAPPRLPLSLLLGIFWTTLFLRSAFTDLDRDSFYVANFVSTPMLLFGPGLMLCMAVIVALEFRRLLYKEYLPIFLLIAAMLIWFTLSFLASDTSPLNAFQFFFGYLQYIILIPFAILCGKDRAFDFRKLTKWILAPIIFEFVVNLLWFLKVSPLKNERRYIPNNIDWAYGTLADTTEVAGIAALIILFSFHILIFKPSHAVDFSRRMLWFLLLAGFMLMLWADSKLTYMTVSLALAIICFLTLRANIFRKVAYTLGGFSFLACMFLASIYYNFMVNPVYSSRITYSDVVQMTVVGGTLAFQDNPKTQTYQDIVEKLPKDLDFPVVGAGPGNATSRFAIKNGTALAGKYIMPRIEWVFNHGNSMLKLPNTGFNALLGDLGWGGMILYYLTLFALFLPIYSAFTSGRITGIQSTWAFVYLVFTVYFFIQSFITDKLYLGSEVAFIWIMGILLRQKSGPPWKSSPARRIESVE
jgi:hypothetical protein